MLLSTIGIRGAACRGREWRGVAGPVVGALFPADSTRASVVHRFFLPVAHQPSDTQRTRFGPMWAFATALAARMTPSRVGGAAWPLWPSEQYKGASVDRSTRTRYPSPHLNFFRGTAASSYGFLASISTARPLIKSRSPVTLALRPAPWASPQPPPSPPLLPPRFSPPSSWMQPVLIT